jgi:hypothetical protein
MNSPSESTTALPGSTAGPFVEAKYQEFLTTNSLSPADPGTMVGQAAAINMSNARANDGSFPIRHLSALLRCGG